MVEIARGMVREPPARLRCIPLRRSDRLLNERHTDLCNLRCHAAAMMATFAEDPVVVVSRSRTPVGGSIPMKHGVLDMARSAQPYSDQSLRHS
jgi:hypothetical protein